MRQDWYYHIFRKKKGEIYGEQIEYGTIIDMTAEEAEVELSKRVAAQKADPLNKDYTSFYGTKQTKKKTNRDSNKNRKHKR